MADKTKRLTQSGTVELTEGDLDKAQGAATSWPILKGKHLPPPLYSQAATPNTAQLKKKR